jgi:HPt (histidine-containing phosphotransfer) domain-containing protein
MEPSTDLSPSDPSATSGARESTRAPSRATADLVASLQQASERQARFLRRLIPLFLLECPQLLHTMRQAIDAGDAAKLTLAAHTLKGTVSFLADGPITEAARQLETRDGNGIRDEARATFAFLDQALAELLPVLVDFANQPERGSSPPSPAP